MRITGKSRSLVCALILSCAASAPTQANFTCSGSISYLGLSYDGVLVVSVGFGIWNVCNVNTSYSNGGISLESATCRAWYASILAAKKTGDPVVLYFLSNANTSNGPECSAIGSWVMPNPLPYFLQVQ